MRRSRRSRFGGLCAGLCAGLMLFAAMFSAPAVAQPACGAPGAPCIVPGGEYFAALPEAAEAPPAVIWLHGYARSGRTMIGKSDYVAPFTRRGYAVIMPTGQLPNESGKLDWGVEDGYDWGRDDVAFVGAVRADAVARFGLDPARILVAGFSRGGSMVWDIACKAPELGRGFAAVSGAFWEPLPQGCAAPVHLLHTHGFGDRLVPFEGREVTFSGFDFVQGNVMKGVDVWRHQNGCMGSARNSFGEDGSMRKDWVECSAGSIRLVLTKGGHGIPEDWRTEVLDWFEALP